VSPQPGKDPFVRRVWRDDAGGVGARWWNDAMEVHSAGLRETLIARRGMLVGLGVGGGVLALCALPIVCDREDDDAVEGSMDALELQRRSGWNVGDVDRSMLLTGTSTIDVDGSDLWRAALADGRLAERLAPPESRLKPFYTPTLFQAPEHVSGRSLAPKLAPIWNAAMQDAYDRGLALAVMFEAAGRPRDTALVIDLPGPEAVAVAAAVSELFAPVFTFNNWPHPKGVVASQMTLGAALYYLPRFEGANTLRPRPAPPAFVLDANRLSPYRDQAPDFDNRYTVALPSIDSFRELGVSHIMYVSASDAVQESDDLNADLSALDVSGVSVRAVAMGDFARDTDDATVAGGARPAGVAPDAGAAGTVAHHYHYGPGGSAGSHFYFWHQYGWYQTAPGPSRRGAPATIQPSRAAAYRPAPRPTMFSARAFGGLSGVGLQKPSGFGRISVRTSPTSGKISVGRSGSFGRGFSSSG
jgi:hypothetical protein